MESPHNNVIHRLNFSSKIERVYVNKTLLIVRLAGGQVSAFSIHKNYSAAFSIDFERSGGFVLGFWGFFCFFRHFLFSHIMLRKIHELIK